MPPVPDDDLIGKAVGHFRVVERLGAGGMGVVYKAIDGSLRRTVALKVLPLDFAADEARRRRFLREARSAAAVTHVNIATVHEVGEAAGRIFIAMELIEGPTLRRILDEGPLGIDLAMRIAKAVARGVAKAHAKGIVHRDLKPDNVMVTEEIDVKVLDFGVATFARTEAPRELDQEAGPLPNAPYAGSPSFSSVDETRAEGHGRTAAPAEPRRLADKDALSRVTDDGQFVGTPAYMAPEQALGLPVDARADVFSFGVLLYEMLAGARPFANAAGAAVLAAKVLEPPSARNPQVTAGLDGVVMRCLQRDPEDRYASAREILTDLEILDGGATSTPSLSSRSMSAATTLTSGTALFSTPGAASGPTSELPPQAATRWAQRWRVATTAIGVAFAASLAVFVGVRATRAKPFTTASLPSSPPDAGAVSGALTARAPPKTANPKALAAFESAVTAFHDGNFEAFDAGMRESIRLDPEFAAGELYVAFAMWHSVRGAVTDARDHLERAQRLRTRLSERDQALLDALEPVINREPPDSDETERRLRAALERWPVDAELLYLLANEERRYDTAKSLATYEKVLEADPGFMTALRQKAQTLEMQGDDGGAREALDECLRRVPAATGCRNERIWLDQDQGRCDLIESDARQMIASDPASFRAYEAMARAAVALGQPAEAVDVLFDEAWSRAPAEVRARDEVLSAAKRAVLDGHFVDARALVHKYEEAIASDAAATTHAAAASLLVDLALETGDVAAAAGAADAFLRRQMAWSGAPDAETGRMLRVVRTSGALDDAQFRARRSEFLDGWTRQGARVRFVKGVSWVLGYASQVETRPDAAEALAALPSFGVVPVGLRTALNDEATGRVFLYGGREADAIAPLGRASRMCNGLDEPFRNVHAHALLGRALEATGNVRGACEAYGYVVERWGHATPRSITATASSGRLRALGCAKQ